MPLYFAYGVNARLDHMERVCGHAEVVGSAVLPDHTTVKVHHHLYGVIEMAVDAPGEIVRGLLWQLPKECLAKLDRQESVPRVYRRTRREVAWVEHSRRVWARAWVYVAP